MHTDLKSGKKFGNYDVKFTFKLSLQTKRSGLKNVSADCLNILAA